MSVWNDMAHDAGYPHGTKENAAMAAQIEDYERRRISQAIADEEARIEEERMAEEEMRRQREAE